MEEVVDLHTSLRRRPKVATEGTAEALQQLERRRLECMAQGDYEGAKQARELILKAPARSVLWAQDSFCTSCVCVCDSLLVGWSVCVCTLLFPALL